jgi:hypothetical protein
MNTLVEFGKIVLPAIVVLYAAYLLVRSFMAKEIEVKKLDVRGKSLETLLPVRLQAYERMTLFLERMSPQNLLLRLNNPGLSARDLQRLLLDEIRNEYNHNVSQQVYISEEVWSQIKNAKEDLTMLINEAITKVAAEGPSIDLAKKIIELTLEKNVDPMGHALTQLKREIQQIF